MAVPTTILDLSTTEASNSPAGSDSAGGTVDNYLRAAYKILRDISLNLSWERWNDTPTYSNSTTFTVAGNLTSRYQVGRFVKATVTAGTAYGVISTSTYSSVTTVVLTMITGTLDSGLSEVALGPDTNAQGTMARQFANAVAITGGSVTGITDLAVADGGTGASTAQNARVNLGLEATSTKNFYVRTDGSDSNDGSANTAGSAFLTIQKAINVASSLVYQNGTININIADGTYVESLVIFGGPSCYRLVLLGNVSTPANVVIKSVTAQWTNCEVLVDGISLTNGTVTYRILASQCADVVIGRCVFGAASSSVLRANSQATIWAEQNFTISGGAIYGLRADNQSQLDVHGLTITLTGTPAFSTVFAASQKNSYMSIYGMTFSGTATGVRYLAEDNGIIFVNGGGATYLPGNASGSTATQGQYY